MNHVIKLYQQKLKNPHHIPVLLNAVIKALNPTRDKIYVDATFGAGSYSKTILNKVACQIIGIDCDNIVTTHAHKITKQYKKNFFFIKDNFSNIDTILRNLYIPNIDGIIFDLGISSMQLHSTKRGFSFYNDAALDMRMDETISMTAQKIVNTLSHEKLSNLLFRYGGEKKSRLIANNIINYRVKYDITSTYQLLEAINTPYHKTKIHYATQTFQALRILINHELDNLITTLIKIPPLLKTFGTITVITFHSLEDKIVKTLFNAISLDDNFQYVSKKVIVPANKEIALNPRARSAKLRSIIKLPQNIFSYNG